MVIFLVGAVVGIGLAVAFILWAFKVQTKESWEAEYLFVAGVHSRASALAAENAQLRVSLAAGEMTEEGKKVATMTMAVIAAERAATIAPRDAAEVTEESAPGPVTSLEPSCSPEDSNEQ
jgi:hypothetical protein